MTFNAEMTKPVDDGSAKLSAKAGSFVTDPL